MKQKLLQAMFAVFLIANANAQVNSGSNGSDGAFNPTTNTVINMADHPTGIYQYTSVNISNVVTVTFIPNANNSPVVWLVQSNAVIDGTVDVSGQSANGSIGGIGGPGGWMGGSGSSGGNFPSPGQGPGGGPAGTGGYLNEALGGGDGSYGTQGYLSPNGIIYGNAFLIPLLGGSGGGGNYLSIGGGGGGGAILIAASNSIQVNGIIRANRGNGYFRDAGYAFFRSGDGSGGAIRLVTTTFSGIGSIAAIGGGSGRVRIDAFQYSFGGTISGMFTQGYQPIIIPTAGQGVQLTVTSVGGVPVSASPSGQLATPDALLSAQQNNPISIVVHCSNIPLNTQITVSVRPANGSVVSATGNNTGTLASSTATVSINMPRGGGIIYATAAN